MQETSVLLPNLDTSINNALLTLLTIHRTTKHLFQQYNVELRLCSSSYICHNHKHSHLHTNSQRTQQYYQFISTIQVYWIDSPEWVSWAQCHSNKIVFCITHTLTGEISQAQVKCLLAVYTRFKETKGDKCSIVLIQTLLRTVTISVCGYNPLRTYIAFDEYLKFDRTMHFQYIIDTNHAVTQPEHATFLLYDHHGFHIPSVFFT